MLGVLLLFAACDCPAGPHLTSGPSGLVDTDIDGHASVDSGGDDCDDSEPSVHPGAPEACNGVDDDCNGVVDDITSQDAEGIGSWCLDGDGDGYGTIAEPLQACAPPAGFGACTDCNDEDAAVNPGEAEICDPQDVDEDCDGGADDDDLEAWTSWSGSLAGEQVAYDDLDGDGVGSIWSYPDYVCDLSADDSTTNTDCDDFDASVTACTMLGADLTLTGPAEYAGIGRSLALGDVNGDGIADALVGADTPYQLESYALDAFADEPAATYVVVDLSPGNRDIAASAAAHYLPAGSTQSYFGYVTAAADLDGDGFADVVIGNEPWMTLADVEVDFGPPDGTVDLVLDSALGQPSYGFATGDATGDGVDDLLIGGEATAWLVSNPEDPDLANATLVFTGDEMGGSVGLGDLDGDGVEDELVGGASGLWLFEGLWPGVASEVDAAALITGAADWPGFSATPVAVSDLDGDGHMDIALDDPDGAGHADVAVFTHIPGGEVDVATADFTIRDDVEGWAGSTLAVGDVDGDGRSDLAIGSDQSAYIVYGPPTNAALTPDLAVLTGETAAYQSANAVALGDVDGDGRADLVVGSQTSSNASALAGAVYVVFGGGL